MVKIWYLLKEWKYEMGKNERVEGEKERKRKAGRKEQCVTFLPLCILGWLGPKDFGL